MTNGIAPIGPRGEDGRFCRGNEFWKMRSTHGAPPRFEDPESLWLACLEYFQWVEDNPLPETKVFHYAGDVTEHEVGKMRAMSISGLCIFLDINETTWRYWRSKRPDLSPITTRAEQVIYTQKFEGAAAGLLNANIISRELGMAGKKKHSGPGGAPLPTPRMSDIEIARRIALVLAQGMHATNDRSEIESEA